jgi:hypothetical protein
MPVGNPRKSFGSEGINRAGRITPFPHLVIPSLMPGIHVLFYNKAWMPVTSTGMTNGEAKSLDEKTRTAEVSDRMRGVHARINLSHNLYYE